MTPDVDPLAILSIVGVATPDYFYTGGPGGRASHSSFSRVIFRNYTGVTGKWGPPILETPGLHIFYNMGTRGPYIYDRYRDPIANMHGDPIT